MEKPNITIKKMQFIYYALENYLIFKKKKDLYIFSKNHEGKKEVFLDEYLKRFMVTNMDFNNTFIK